MSNADKYDVLVLGSGAGGKSIAWAMAREGRRIAVVERKLIGGSCPNIACLPSKNVIHTAKVASLFARREEFGILTGPIAIDMAGVYERKHKMVEGLIQLHLDLYRTSGAELILGNGQFIGPRTLQVELRDGGERVVTGERVFVNVGTRATIPGIPGLAEARPMTHIEALDLDRLPEHLIVLGGGYVGLELAQAMRRFGSQVTVIERGPQLASREDPDVGAALLALFQDEGIDVLLGTRVSQVEGHCGEHMRVHAQDGRGARIVEGTDLLVATGRTPNTDGIGLEQVGVERNGHGYITVNERLETTAANVWAMGDCAGSPQFTHAAYDDFRVVYANLTGGQRTTKDRLVPFCMFTDPELVRVGLSEGEARARGIEARVAKLPTSAVLRAKTIDEERGFLKALVAPRRDE